MRTCMTKAMVTDLYKWIIPILLEDLPVNPVSAGIIANEKDIDVKTIGQTKLIHNPAAFGWSIIERKIDLIDGASLVRNVCRIRSCPKND